MEAGWRNMLTNLHVKNLALIEEENVDFEEGLNILSGETGAGKSIILGSINAALGAKTSPDFIRTGAEYGLAELMFDIDDKKTLDKIKELGVLDIEDGELLISRKITPTRSQIKVNGQNFTAAQTQKLARYLIDMHGQHDNQILMDDSTHINVVDEYCLDDISALKEMMKNDYQHYMECKNELSEMDKDNEERQREISFLEYEVNEITAAGLKRGEDEELEAQFKKLNNRQKIMNELSGADMLLNSGEDNISDMLGMAVKALVNAAEYDESLKNPLEMLQDVESLIMDVSHDISAYIDDTTDFEFNTEYNNIIEKYAENVYRTISQKIKQLPSSSQTIKNNVLKDTIKLTPQESEQLSKYVSDDTFVKTQKEDIESLASIYKELLNDQENGGDNYYIDVFKDNFTPSPGYKSTYMLSISDKDKLISIYVDGSNIEVELGENRNADVIGKLNKETFDNIVNGQQTFHRAFMTGAMTARGNLKTLRMLDEIFRFQN